VRYLMRKNDEDWDLNKRVVISSLKYLYLF